MNALQRLADIQPGGIGERAPSVRQPVDAIERHTPTRQMTRRERYDSTLTALTPRLGQTSGPQGGLWAYATQSAYACVNKIADAVVAQEWKVQRDDRHTAQGEAEDVWAGHWLVRLLNNPNPDYTRSHIYKLLVRWYYATGNAYFWTPKHITTPDESLGMWPLAPHRMRAVVGEGGVTGWLYQGTRGQVPFEPGEILHYKNLEPGYDTERSLLYGVSPLLPVYRALGLEVDATEYQSRYLKNDALPAFAVKFRDGAIMDDDQFQTYKQRWNETMQGEKGKWVVLEDGADIQTLSDGGQLEDLVAIPPKVLEQVAILLGVPPKLLTWDAVNYASSQSIRADFHANTILPLVRYFGEEATRHYRHYEAGLIVRPTEVQFLDKAEERAQEAHELANGIKSINQARAERGEEPVPGGDVHRINGIPLTAPPTPPAAP